MGNFTISDTVFRQIVEYLAKEKNAKIAFSILIYYFQNVFCYHELFFSPNFLKKH